MTRRAQRVSDLLRAELAVSLHSDVSDPRVRLANIAEVSVSSDLRSARVRVSVLGSDDERRECVEALQHARGFIRTRLAGRLRLRYTPQLSFELDRGAEYAERITSLLEDADDHSQSP